MYGKKFFPVVLFMATLGFAATDIYLPSMPTIAKDFLVSKTGVQLGFVAQFPPSSIAA